ncbi:Phage tail fiber protein [Escherichia coli]|nr:Phage tail fiber protein [Escherichia coli]
MTEVIPGLHDVTGAIELPEDNWFFTMTEIPQGMELTINEKGEPILIEVNQSQGIQAK